VARGAVNVAPGKDSGLKEYVGVKGVDLVCAGDGKGRCKGAYIVWIG
jgi:hypothetical protein